MLADGFLGLNVLYLVTRYADGVALRNVTYICMVYSYQKSCMGVGVGFGYVLGSVTEVEKICFQKIFYVFLQ